MKPKQPNLLPRNASLLQWWIIFTVLTAVIFPCRAGYNTAFYLNTSSYTGVEGTSITGTVTREALNTGCTSSCDWFPASPATVTLQIPYPGTGTYPIQGYDVTSNGLYYITIAANQTIASFSIPLAHNTNVDYDRTGNLNIASGYVDSNHIQSASLTIQDNNNPVGVGFYAGGSLYVGSTSITEGATGGANQLTIRFFREYSQPQGRTINYSLTGSTAVAGTDYTPSIGTVTIPMGSSYADVTITANNTNQTTDKTLSVTITGGTYAYYAPYTNLTVTIYNDYPTVEVVTTSSQMIRGDTTSSLIFYRDYYFTNSGTARTVHYSVGGTANNGGDFTPSLSGTVVIPAGSGAVTNTLTPAIESSTNGTKTLTVTYSSGSGYTIGANNSASISILEDFPNVDVIPTPSTMTRGESTCSLVFLRESYYPGVSASKTVNYTIAGSTASNGVDFTPSLSGSAVIPAGGYAVTNTLTPGTESSLNGTKILNMALQSGTMYYYGANSNAAIGILEDAPMIGVTASTPTAYQNGTPGTFSITRTYGYPKSVTAYYAISGTAVAGTNYTNLPSSVTFAPYQTATNLTIGPTLSPLLTNAQTVVLTITSNSLYYPGDTTQAVVTITPNSSTSNSVSSPVGRYWRGTGSDPTYWSFVVPLDYEEGITYNNLFGNCSNLYPGLVAWDASTFYHYNATNSTSKTNWATRIPFNNPIVAFGERVGGTPLYVNQEYNFGIYAGDPISVATPLTILAYYRTNYGYAGQIDVYPPNFSNTNSWNGYTSNGFQVTATGFGLTTTLSTSPNLGWGSTSRGACALAHTATNAATNYYYVVVQYGIPNSQSFGMAQDTNGSIAPSYLYSLEFEQRPAWRAVMIDQPHFDGNPLPPFYAGMTLDELLTNTPPVTNAVSLAPSACTNIDQSPELRRHPILDQFVADMGNDPMALANYVLKQIDLTDPMDYNDNGNVSEQSINLGGISRGALGTFLEKQGSPLEQCALLVYLLRQAGVPATYMFAPHNGLQILDARLSRMLKFQVDGGFNDAGALYTTNTMIPVNYPWVAAYIGTNWIHIFPWLKDYEIVEGLDLYDYMPTNYSDAYGWVRDYIYGNSNLLSLAVNGNNTPSVIFPRFLAQTLQQNYPGVSVGDIGVEVLNRRHNYSRWQDFPTPTWLTNTSLAVESLTANSITNVDPLMTNIFDTVSVELYSEIDPRKDIQTGPMRLTDLHNRQFYITQTNNATNQILSSLVLAPFRTNVTTQYAFTNDSALLSKEVLSTTLDQFDDVLSIRITYNRHRALSPSYPIDPTLPFLEFKDSPSRQIVIERPLRKGDLAAICLDYGRVTQDMLNVHATDLWQMENTLRANPSAAVSPDVYQGATLYLAGMSYYKKVSDFDLMNQNLHKVNVLSSWAAGLSKLGPRRDSSGNLVNGGVDPVFPNVDMAFQEVAEVANETLRPDSGQDLELAMENYNLIRLLDGSAQEHQVLNDYYNQSNAVSTVRLLQLAQSSGYGIVTMNINNYVSQGQTVYQGNQLQNFDSYVWNQLASAMQSTAYGDYGFITAYMTAGPITNASYSGVGALILGWAQSQAIISPFSLNGGFGQNLPANSVSSANAVNYNLTMGDTATLTFQTPSAATSLLPDQIANFNASQTYNQILSGDYTATPYDSTWSSSVQSQLGLPSQGTQNQTLAQDVQTTESSGWLGIGGLISQAWSKVADPVHNVTGEFYVDETDLQLAGPIPLSVRRNYSSQNLADNQFGPGWKFSVMPYLSIGQGGSNIYAADMDGAVLAYVQTPTNASVWLPTTAANPELVNNTTAGVGGLVNRLRDRLVQTVNGSTTNFALYGADGSIRAFQFMTFNNGVLNQARPYLLAWTNNCGNYYTFTYGTDPSQPDFGQVRRIQCSNGNYLGFYYDVYGHIIQAYCGDGRRLTYDYDQFGDLITVTLPDGTTRSYQYLHSTQSVTNGSTISQQPYSTHLIVEEDKPDGRVLQSAYDNQRRVTNQLSTAGADLTPVRTATFIYSNNFNFTNSPTNTITGYTLVIDGNNHTNRYDYTNSLIIQITDPLGQTVQQIWYADNATAPGYPRSVSQRKDKRGVWTQFSYDSNGNVTNKVITGDVTGDGISTQTATNTAIYSTNNLPLQLTDPVGNSTMYIYDTYFTFLPQQIIRYAGATPISTNFQIYGSVTNIVTLGATTQTNFALGVMTRQIRGFSSPDAATNDYTYNGQGFITQTVRYTGTGDPSVTNTFFYNERGEMVTQADALGAETEFAYDDMGRQTEQENLDENGNLLSWNFNYYNDNGDLTWIDGPRYNPEDYLWRDYDGAGRVTTEIHWRCEAKQDGTGVEAPAGYNVYAQTFYLYDILGNLLRTVDPRGAVTTNTWDALCRLVQRRSFDVDGVTLLAAEGFAYEPGGLIQYHTNALGGVTETVYTAVGQPEFRLNADGSTNAWRYYLDGRIYRQFQCNGAYWQTTYDDVDRITTNIFYSAAGVPLATNSSQLDHRGNTIQRIDADQNVFTSAYDGLDRTKVAMGPAIVTVSGGSGAPGGPGGSGYTTNVLQESMTYFYDGSGRILTTTNTLGEKVVTTKDAIGRVISVQTYAPGSGTPLRVTATSYTADHHGFTVTEGTGTGTISATTYTDNDGRTLLTARSPSTGQWDYDLHQYDLAGNEIEHAKASTGSNLWSFTSWTFDGLNRKVTETTRDFATSSFGYDALGDLTSRAMPGGLSWSASYSSAGQIMSEHDQSGTQGARTNTYTYYSSSWPGLLQTVTDGRGITRTNFYDDFLRLTNTVTGGSQAEQQIAVTWQYEPRGLVTAMTQSYASTNTGPSTTIQRTYDPYAQLSSESLTVGSGTSTVNQQWDAAGRRTQLSTGMSFQYRADNLITVMNDATFGYGDNGLLTGRTNSFRSMTVNSRDPLGRPLQMTTKVFGSTQLTETWNWLDDGSPSNYVAARSDFTDTRNFTYGALTRKLTTETLNAGSGISLTNSYIFDNGVAAGLGVLTKVNELSAVSNSWSGGVDALSRISAGTNTVIQRSASGHVNGAATLRGYLNSRQIDLRYDSSAASAWSATFGLQPGTNTLAVYADHPGGLFTTNRISTFTVNSGSQDKVASQYDGAGNVTNLTWKNGSGQTIKSQTLTWDAFDRLVKVNERDTNNNGFNLVITFDALGRQVQTVETTVSNNIALSVGPEPLSVGYTYDPQVEFQVVGFSLNQGPYARQDWLAYGPDTSGQYGGMQGVGGLEEITSGDAGISSTAGIISDGFGNVLAGVTNGTVTWNSARMSLYGPADGYAPPRLSLASPAYASLAWRTRAINTAGLVQLGLRPYDFTRRAFLSADPLGHSADGALNTAFNGSPGVYFDADGRIGVGFYQGWNSGGSPANSTGSFDAGYWVGGVLGGFNQGYQEGAAIVADTATLGEVDSIHSYANTLQGGVYDASRGLAAVGIGSAALATGGWALDAAIASSPTLYSAALTVGTSPWTPVALGAATAGYLSYSQGGSPSDIAFSAALGGAMTYTANPFPFGGSGVSSTLETTPAVDADTLPPKVLILNGDQYPVPAANLEEANAVGVPLPVNRDAAAANRQGALNGLQTIPGYDLDEAPPAMFRNPGDTVIVRPTPPAQNRGAGASLGNQARPVPNGGQVIIIIKRSTPGGTQ